MVAPGSSHCAVCSDQNLSADRRWVLEEQVWEVGVGARNIQDFIERQYSDVMCLAQTTG